MDYDKDDLVKNYFVINKADGKRKIQAWSPDKQLAKYYMEIHNNPNFELIKIEKAQGDMNIAMKENMYDKIKPVTLMRKNKDKKKGYELVYVPMTINENRVVTDETNTFLSTYIDWNLLNQAVPYLKKKYRLALQTIFLSSMLKLMIENKADKYNQNIELDQLKILFKAFPDSFG